MSWTWWCHLHSQVKPIRMLPSSITGHSKETRKLAEMQSLESGLSSNPYLVAKSLLCLANQSAF